MLHVYFHGHWSTHMISKCSPSTTPTPTLLRRVFMGATNIHSLALGLYTSTDDSPAGKHSSATCQSVSQTELMMHVFTPDGLIWTHYTSAWCDYSFSLVYLFKIYSEIFYFQITVKMYLLLWSKLNFQCHMTFRNHSNILIYCSQHISDSYQCWKQLSCFIFLCKMWFSEFLHKYKDQKNSHINI